jgi:hypothetical protein
VNFSEIMRRKVAGIPVIYLAAAAVLVLAIVAWRMKPTTDPVEAQGEPEAGSDEPSEGDPYRGFETTGTVVAQQPNATEPAPVEETNYTWAKKGAEWLTREKGVPGTQAAQALAKHLEGIDTSFQEQEWINLVIKEYGQPPDGVSAGQTTVKNAPAKRQGNPPLVHTVMGPNDNDYGPLETLYYPGYKGQGTRDLLQSVNQPLGHAGPWAVGTKVNVPAYHSPVYYTTPTTMSITQVAAKNGTTAWAIEALNNTNSKAFPKGKKLRVK